MLGNESNLKYQQDYTVLSSIISTVLSRNSGSRNSGFSHNSGQNCDDGIFIK